MSNNLFENLLLNQCQIIDAVYENRTAAPASPKLGQYYFDTVLKRTRIYNGTSWDISSASSTGSGVTSITGSASVTVDATDPEVPVLSVPDATASDAGLLSSANYNDLNNATSAPTANTFAKRDANGNFQSGTPTTGSDVINRTYFDTAMASGLKVPTALDCSANPNYPAADAGDTFRVTVAGKVGGASGELVQSGDMIFCNTTSVAGDHATVGANFNIVQNNLDYCTDTVPGTIRLATAAEAAAGTATDVACSPGTVTTIVQDVTGNDVYLAKLSAGATSYPITHGLTGAITVDTYDKTTRKDITMGVTRTSGTVITLTSAAPMPNDVIVTCSLRGAEPA